MLKYNFIVFVCFFCSLFLISTTYAKFNDDFPLLNRIIYIDPGHGGVDPGAVYKEIKEADINLNFSLAIGKKIEQLGGTVFYTRTDDYDLASTKNSRKKSDLSNRVKIINESNCDLYLSIHVNSDSSNKWYGAQVFYTNKNNNNKLIADAFDKVLKLNNITKRKSSVIKNIYMYDRINQPGILLEIGFISNYSDRNKMQDTKYIEEFSNIVGNAIIKYFQ